MLCNRFKCAAVGGPPYCTCGEGVGALSAPRVLTQPPDVACNKGPIHGAQYFPICYAKVHAYVHTVYAYVICRMSYAYVCV